MASGTEEQPDDDDQLGRIRAAVAGVIVGKEEAVEQLLVALLCRGHALLEDVPGVGKTLLARSLAASMACGFRRIQFTPDVLPTDVTGSSVFDQRSASFEFRPGPVFTQILLADEINRATPRAQSALLEAMEERQVTVDGETMALPRPFLVLATQNPVELEGTFPLPEAQLDRFLVRVTLGYPSAEEEDAILRRFERDDPFARLEAVVSPEDVVRLQDRRGEIEVSDPVRAYLLEVVRATRTDERVALGASPRAALALHRAAQARALLQGRPYVLPDDIKALARAVLAHRLLLTAQSRLRGDTPEGVIASVVDSVAVPVEDEGRLAAAPGTP
ncbi:MAG: MoxR family ATPase [Acidimicrobiaceae bacterium]|nr:MoxR family ATPase [Acidimicrobiaceae bacterium]MBO0747226.1 MoxR family ATPase [Acidimicrobiaceae bacterium]